MSHSISKPAHAAILRVTKLRLLSAVASSAGHTWRSTPVAHADSQRTQMNQDWRNVGRAAQLLDALKGKLATVDRRAKDAVLALEYLVTARSESFQDQGGPVAWEPFFRDALAFLEDRHGRDNILAVNIQLDEAAPHMVTYVVPLVERPARIVRRQVFAGKGPDGQQRRALREFAVPAETVLSAAHYVGSREKLRTLQTDFAHQVAIRHGLRRGIERSALTHADLKAYHDAVGRSFRDHLNLDPEALARRGGLLRRESPGDMAQRLTGAIHDHYAPVTARAATAEHDRRRADEAMATATRIQGALNEERQSHGETRKQLASLTQGLARGQVAKIEEYAEKCRAVNARRRREQEEKRQREAAERARAAQERENGIANALRESSAEELARLPDSARRECWDLLFSRPDLADAADIFSKSPLFEINGRLSDAGQALVSGSPAKDLQQSPSPRPPSPGSDSAPGMG